MLTANYDKKMHVQPKRLKMLFVWNFPNDRCDRKTPKNDYLEVGTTLTVA